jgi:hypothetical protein
MIICGWESEMNQETDEAAHVLYSSSNGMYAQHYIPDDREQNVCAPVTRARDEDMEIYFFSKGGYRNAGELQDRLKRRDHRLHPSRVALTWTRQRFISILDRHGSGHTFLNL